MTTATILLLIPVGFAVTLLAAPTWLEWLRRLKFGKQIRLEGPASHQAKAGTPTMGGWLFVATAAVIPLIVGPDRPTVAIPVAAMLLFATAGALDDYANVKRKSGLGFRVRYKFVWHALIALAISWWLYQMPELRSQRLPGGASIDLGVWFIPAAVFAIFGSAAGVNEVDGLDGLAGGTSLFAFTSYLVLSLVAGLAGPAVFAAVLMGGLLGFLWYNTHPAKVFMGDTGSLGLGAALAVVAIQTRWGILLPIIGFVFVLDTVSVILQVTYFKLTHGRRLFLMTPIHHGFEKAGWPETLVVGRFWIMGIIAGIVGVAVAQ
jgi:phospho-N-acetylmuramoyl-pentapeptide-transferase